MHRLPLFVLEAVLFPGTILPLHVFEPRYRRMVARCLEGDRRFGFLYHDYDVEPAFEPREGRIGCTAEILQFQPLPDGRSLLLARGLDRFRITDGIESTEPYHEALVEEFCDIQPLPGDIRERRASADALFRTVLKRLDPNVAEVPAADLDGDVSFAIAAAIQIDTQWKQMLLELPTERARLHQIEIVLLPLSQ